MRENTMPTFREIMDAAHQADAAGDAEGAKRLLSIAADLRSGRGYSPQQATQVNDKAGELVVPTSGAEGPYLEGMGRRPDRFGDTIKSATEAPIAATKHYAGEVLNPDNSVAERAGAAAMTGISALGAGVAGAAGTVGEIVGGDPTSERKLARDLMLGAEVAVPELAGASSTARLGMRAARVANNTPDVASDAARTARAADDLGVTPALGATGKTTAQVSAGLEKVPFSGSVIAKDAMRYVDDVVRAFDDAVDRVGQVRTSEGAGSALKGGIDKWVSKFREKSEQLYTDVGRYIPNDTVIRAPETVRMIREAIAPFADKPAIRAELGLDKWARLADDLESGLTWEAATSLRSNIGKSVGKIKGPMADMDQGKLKLAYGKLTDDLGAAAETAGKDAYGAWKHANNFYAKGAKRIGEGLDKTIRADSPERAFEAFANMAKEGRASSDIRRMYQIKASMPGKEWGEVAATIVGRLGKKGDDFSPAQFLTEWNKIGDDAKRILLTPQARKEMDQIVALAEGSKRINAERNFSNTGNVGALLATGAGGVTNLPLTLLALGSAHITARAMTSERFLRAINKAARGDDRILRAIAKSNEPIATDAATILRLSASEAAAGGQAANVNEPARAAVR